MTATGHTPTTSTGAPLLEVRDLSVTFPVRGADGKKMAVHAVNDLSFTIERGRTVGLVGESGSGKSTIGNAIMGLVPAAAGQVALDGEAVIDAAAGRRGVPRWAAARRLRRRVTMVFQDPLAALDPRLTVSDSVAEPLQIHGLGSRGGRRSRVAELLDLTGLPQQFMDRYPHELSGGQRQRVCIARALAADPDLVILDEATASLDVSVQAQIMNLLKRLQEELGLAYLFISHDLATVEHMSDRVLVLYLGRQMEDAPQDVLYEQPGHPYTQALMSAVPHEDPVVERSRERILLTGDVPSPLSPPSGCVFRTRCPLAIDECAREVPPPRELAPGQRAWCIRAGERVLAEV